MTEGGYLYRHTQTGYLLLVALGAGLLMVLAILFLVEFHWVGVFVALLMALCLYTFSSLTVEVSTEAIHVIFRGGLIRRRFLLRDILVARSVRSPWYYGWGVRLIFGGWLYNVSGSNAIELRLKNGRRYLIGTDDPEGLAAVLAALTSP